MRWTTAMATAALGFGLGLGLAGCAGSEPTADAASESAAAATDTGASAAAEPIPRSEIPEAQAFLGWRENDSLTEKPRPEDAPRAALACADKHLFPTHPSSDRKRYHRAAIGRYDYFKLDGASSICKIKGTTKDPRTGLLRCLSSDELQYIVLSDTFEDGCGNMYRGFWAVSFFSMDENMGTLMSLGRTVYQNPHSEFQGDMYDASTYAVEEKQLLLLSPLFAGDADAIAHDRKSATDAKTHHYDPSTHLWEYIGPNR